MFTLQTLTLCCSIALHTTTKDAVFSFKKKKRHYTYFYPLFSSQFNFNFKFIDLTLAANTLNTTQQTPKETPPNQKEKPK